MYLTKTRKHPQVLLSKTFGPSRPAAKTSDTSDPCIVSRSLLAPFWCMPDGMDSSTFLSTNRLNSKGNLSLKSWQQRVETLAQHKVFFKSVIFTTYYYGKFVEFVHDSYAFCAYLNSEGNKFTMNSTQDSKKDSSQLEPSPFLDRVKL